MKKLLLVIDFINDIVDPAGKICSVADYVNQHGVMTAANAAIAKFRQDKAPIVHVKVGFSANYDEAPENSPMFGARMRELGALQLGAWGTEFHQQMDVQADDRIIVKHRVSALYATPLMAILRGKQIDTVVLSGVSTNMAIETVARELHDRDFNVIVLEDACGAASAEIHQASLLTLQRITKVCTVSDLAT